MEPVSLPRKIYGGDFQREYKKIYTLCEELANFHNRLIHINGDLEDCLAKERLNSEAYRKAHSDLLNKHRRLPPGSLPVPERRKPPIIIGDKGPKLSTDDNLEEVE